MCDITQQMNDDWEKKNKDLLHITYMTLEQKAMLRRAMRSLSSGRNCMKCFEFADADKWFYVCSKDLQILANAVEMNGKVNKDEKGDI